MFLDLGVFRLKILVVYLCIYVILQSKCSQDKEKALSSSLLRLLWLPGSQQYNHQAWALDSRPSFFLSLCVCLFTHAHSYMCTHPHTNKFSSEAQRATTSTDQRRVFALSSQSWPWRQDLAHVILQTRIWHSTPQCWKGGPPSLGRNPDLWGGRNKITLNIS